MIQFIFLVTYFIFCNDVVERKKMHERDLKRNCLNYSTKVTTPVAEQGFVCGQVFFSNKHDR